MDFQGDLHGTITLTTGELAVSKNLTITGPGPDMITVSGGNHSRVFNTSATVTISGLTIADGESAAPGGGIRNTGTLTVANSVVRGNAVHYSGNYSSGGGIYSDGALTVLSCLVTANSVTVSNPSGYAHGYGGGVINGFGSRLTITDSVITNNTAITNGFPGSDTYSSGGGVYNRNASLTITNSIITGNVSRSNVQAYGGALDTGFFDTTVRITNSTISRNVTEGTTFSVGGGIFTRSRITILNSTISGNASHSADASNSRGGGIYNEGSMDITTSTISRNAADGVGGGIYNSGGTVTVTSAILSGNTATGDGGGGIFVGAGGTLTVIGCTFAGNSSNLDGGALLSVNSMATVVSSTFISNSAPREDGGAINNAGGQMTVSDSTFSRNSANVGGGIYNGAILAPGGTLTVTGCTFTENSAFGGGVLGGGGLSNARDGVATVINSTFSHNTAGNGGGILNSSRFGESTLTVINSTIADNSASASGGGFGREIVPGTTVLRNTIIAGNHAPTSPDLATPVNSQGHNLIGDGTGGGGYDPTDLVGTSSNPIDPRLGLLADNGGPTQTMALLPGSPAIDAGDNTDAPEWDQRGPGFPRIVNGIIDIGAFEFQGQVTPTITCSVATSLLWPPNHRLVVVGLNVTVDPPDANLHILVYANDNASPSDAADIGSDTLRLRSERQGNGTGRVYLIVVTATDSGGTSFDTCAVAVPHDHSPRSIASVQQQAAAAEAYYQEFQTAPPGYHLLGEGPDGGSGAPSSGRSGRSAISGDVFGLNPPAPATPLASPNQTSLVSVAEATVPAEHLLSAWAAAPVDGYFATAYEQGSRLTLPGLEQAGWAEGNGPALDWALSDDRLMV